MKRRLAPAVLAATLWLVCAPSTWAADLPAPPVALPQPAVTAPDVVPQPVSQAVDAVPAPVTPQQAVEPAKAVVEQAKAAPAQVQSTVGTAVQRPERAASGASQTSPAIDAGQPRRSAAKHALHQSPTGLPAVDRVHHEQRAGQTALPSRLASASAAESRSPVAAAAAELDASRGRPDGPSFPLPAPFGAAADGAGSSGGLLTLFVLLLAAVFCAAPEVGARLLPGSSVLRRLRIVSLLERPG